MKPSRKSGMSLLGTINALSILALVLMATIITVAPHGTCAERVGDRDIAFLNAMAQTYCIEQGKFPRSLEELADYLSRRNDIRPSEILAAKQHYVYSAATGQFSHRAEEAP